MESSAKEYELLQKGVVHICTKCKHCISPEKENSAKCVLSSTINTEYWVAGKGDPFKYRYCSNVRTSRVCENYEEKENE